MAQEKGWFGRMMYHLGERLKAIPAEVAETMTDKVIPQGASEIAQALNSQSNAYVPYGAAQRPLEVEGPSVSYQDMLRDASQRAGQEQERGMDR